MIKFHNKTYKYSDEIPTVSEDYIKCATRYTKAQMLEHMKYRGIILEPIPLLKKVKIIYAQFRMLEIGEDFRIISNQAKV